MKEDECTHPSLLKYIGTIKDPNVDKYLCENCGKYCTIEVVSDEVQ